MTNKEYNLSIKIKIWPIGFLKIFKPFNLISLNTLCNIYVKIKNIDDKDFPGGWLEIDKIGRQVNIDYVRLYDKNNTDVDKIPIGVIKCKDSFDTEYKIIIIGSSYEDILLKFTPKSNDNCPVKFNLPVDNNVKSFHVLYPFVGIVLSLIISLISLTISLASLIISLINLN